ncbi:YdiU family protein [Exilibacterium tricleocarpae]|uniref:Protein nucleotidyltransferase YdiU n=1 Tax=Exilibacterium tricleocarpae TaxID=2591008 RepID=A0A545TSD3_9GAMM|nr:YdiU family protein [Exilibacterium tricleocarpae]TQV80134.1 YdiU family protein [Exilibacterium tricleocarpae]
MNALQDLHYRNHFSRLGSHFFSYVQPDAFTRPHLVHTNDCGAALIGLDSAAFTSPAFLEYFSGRRNLPGCKPLAMVYAGHQFGVYNPQLGDGRGLLLGEVEGPGGLWDIHLKGAGQTPYSRNGDGRAVLRSSIREYLGSEALAGLGIPTTRALALIGGDEPVYRESVETGAMLVRLARSHVRFGSFEYFHYRHDYDAVKQLADYVIDRQFTDSHHAAAGHRDKYWQLLHAAVTNTAHLIAQWQAVGFCHGVMNTDNMSILGETFDFGPFAFMDDFEPGYICNHSDYQGRYAFEHQPGIGLWNLTALGHSLSSLLDTDAIKDALSHYEPTLTASYAELMRAKLGLATAQADDKVLCVELLDLLARQRVDYTRFFRALSHTDPTRPEAALLDLFDDREATGPWLQRYGQRLLCEEVPPAERQRRMLATNPKYILRNYLAQEAITAAAQGDFSHIDTLLRLLRHPFDEQPQMDNYARPPPHWGKHMPISCSS